MMRMRNIAVAMLLCASLGCGGDSSGPPALARIIVLPGSSTIAPGGTVQLVADARDASGNSVHGQTVTWSSDNQQVATVNAAGLVSGVGEGSATITAAAGGITGTSSVVVQVPVAGVTVTPSSP